MASMGAAASDEETPMTAQARWPRCRSPRARQPDKECSRSEAVVRESICSSGNCSASSSRNRLQNFSRASRLTGRSAPAQTNSSVPALLRPNRWTSRTMRPGDCSATRRTRRTRLHSSDHRWISVAAPWVRTSQWAFERAASHRPFSCTSTRPEVASSASAHSISVATPMPGDYKYVKVSRMIIIRKSLTTGRHLARGLLEQQAGHSDDGKLAVPVRRHVFEVELEFTALPGGQRRGARAQHAPGIAQNDLIERVAELEGRFHLADGAGAVVCYRAEHKSDFLVQEVGSAAHLQVEKTDLPGISLFGGGHRQPLLGPRRLRPGGPGQQEGAAKQQQHNSEAGKECERYAGFIFLEHGLSSFSALRARGLAHRPKARRRMSGSGSPARFMRCCTASMSYGTRQNSTTRLSRSTMANAARGSPSRGWPIEPGLSR